MEIIRATKTAEQAGAFLGLKDVHLIVGRVLENLRILIFFVFHGFSLRLYAWVRKAYTQS